MARTPTGNRHQTIHCDICGEDYASTYKRCPFCDGRPPEEEGASPRRKRGKRTNNRGGGYSSGPSPMKIFTTILSLALIVAAVCIVVSIVKPMIDKGKTPPATSATPAPTASTPPSAEPSTPPEPAVPADQTATGFTLDKSDFTMSFYGESHPIKVTFTPAGSKGYIEWTSSNPEVVSVDENGNVKAIGKVNGVSRATITATLKGTQVSQTCIARCSFEAPSGAGTAVAPSTAPSGGGTTSSNAKLNYSDFTMRAGTTVQMSVSGATGTPVWSIGNTAVATVSETGLVTMVGKGNTTLTCTINGQTLTCVVRCSG
ncbi:MAG: Ig-like domain-containing protein [Clostridiales bacterium]|nr:Ig-like domain-containing protein [Clostridiales bacterium]MDY4181296.1 Ig-like domain-containing protein [Pseudoflavonifractor sp.]